jgi:tetratricopeptide (TPR) repeat protein
MEHFPTAWSNLRQAEELGGPFQEINLEKLLLAVQQTGELTPEAAGLQRALDTRAPESPGILSALAMGALRARRLDLVNKWLELWLQLYPQDWRAHFFRGTFFSVKAQWPQAEDELEEAAALHPDYAETHRSLGVAQVRGGHKYADAIHHLEFYLQRFPESLPALTALAQAQLELGQRPTATATIERLLAKDPRHAWGLLLQAQIRLDEGRAEEALATLKTIDIPETPDLRERSMLLFLTAKAHRLLGQLDQAAELERQYREMDGDIQKLGSAMESATAPGQDPNLQRKIGLLYLRLHNATEAQRWFDAVLKVNPDDKIIHRALADYFDSRSDAESRERAAEHRAKAGK